MRVLMALGSVVFIIYAAILALGDDFAKATYFAAVAIYPHERSFG